MFKKLFLISFLNLFLHFNSEASINFELSTAYTVDNYLVDKPSKSRNDTLGVLLIDSKFTNEHSVLSLSILGTHSSGSPTDFVKDSQVVSNIDLQGDEGLKVYELKYEYVFQKYVASAGWVDLSNSFNITKSSQGLINSSFGTSAEFGNTGANGPSIYPVPSFGFGFAINNTEKSDFYLLLAISDPLPTDKFKSNSLEYDISLDKENYLLASEFGVANVDIYKAGLGIWEINTQNEISSFKQNGIYAQFDYKFKNLIYPFIRIGKASRLPKRIYSNLAFGMSLLKISENIPGSFTIGYSSVQIGEATRSEEVFEVLYTRDLIKNLNLSVGYQHIDKPGGESGNADVGILRLQFQNNWIRPI